MNSYFNLQDPFLAVNWDYFLRRAESCSDPLLEIQYSNSKYISNNSISVEIHGNKEVASHLFNVTPNPGLSCDNSTYPSLGNGSSVKRFPKYDTEARGKNRFRTELRQ